MKNRRRGSHLTVSFQVRDNRWIMEEGWKGDGRTERERHAEFKDVLYGNLTAQYATELAALGWTEFQTVVAQAILPALANVYEVYRDHLGSEFWEGVGIRYQAALTCALIEKFAHPYGELESSLLGELRQASVRLDDDPWTTTLHALLLTTSLPVRFTLPAGEVPLVFGTAHQSCAVTVDWSLVLPRVTRLNYLLDAELADLDEFDGFP